MTRQTAKELMLKTRPLNVLYQSSALRPRHSAVIDEPNLPDFGHHPFALLRLAGKAGVAKRPAIPVAVVRVYAQVSHWFFPLSRQFSDPNLYNLLIARSGTLDLAPSYLNCIQLTARHARREVADIKPRPQ